MKPSLAAGLFAVVSAALAFGAGCSEVADVLEVVAPGAGGETAGSPAMSSDAGAESGGVPGSAGGSSGGDASGSGGETPPDPALGFWIDAGDAHTCATHSGILYCWGDNGSGRLGVGDTSDRDRPTRVGGDADWVEVAAASAHTCALKADRSVWCFGANDQGQLGRAGSAESPVPLRVELPAAVAQLSSTSNHACAVLSTGELYCWGYNIEGGLGLNDTHPGMNQFEPVRVGELGDWSRVGAGQGHTCAIRAAGALFGWGRNTAANLGLGSTVEQQRRAPTPIGADLDWQAVASGQDASCGIRALGQLFCWGGNEFGTLGLGDRTQRLSPTQSGAGRSWTAISLDTFHACGIDTEGGLFCWGRNLEGQLGSADNDDRLSAERVGDSSEPAARVAVGRMHSCAASLSGKLWCTGENIDGRLGLGDRVRRNAFAQVTLPD